MNEQQLILEKIDNLEFGLVVHAASTFSIAVSFILKDGTCKRLIRLMEQDSKLINIIIDKGKEFAIRPFSHAGSSTYYIQELIDKTSKEKWSPYDSAVLALIICLEQIDKEKAMEVYHYLKENSDINNWFRCRVLQQRYK